MRKKFTLPPDLTWCQPDVAPFDRQAADYISRKNDGRTAMDCTASANPKGRSPTYAYAASTTAPFRPPDLAEIANIVDRTTRKK